MRWILTIAIAGLLVLTWLLPSTSLGRRGREAAARAEARDALVSVGERFPDLAFEGLDRAPVRTADFRGQRLLITFERSVDW